MAQLSSQFKEISPGMDLDQAQSGLVSMMKAFDVDVSNVKKDIMDNVNDLGNKFALSNKDIVDGMSKSSAAMSAMGQSLKDTMALFVGGQEILQDADSMGSAMRAIAMRVRGRNHCLHMGKVHMLCYA